jgi:tRNA threonylcarbamoyladenosine biosynthesis protein TsaE
MTHVSILASPVSPQDGQHTDLVWDDEAACQHMAAQLAHAMAPHLRAGGSLTLELHGTLGAGKTTFTRHLLRALGVTGRIKSPSYAVVEVHELPEASVHAFSIHHFDFYRFNNPQEWEDAGFRDIFGAPGLKVVEWPEKAAGLLPAPDVQLHITLMGEPGTGLSVNAAPARHVSLRVGTPSGHSLLGQIVPPAEWVANVTKEACDG